MAKRQRCPQCSPDLIYVASVKIGIGQRALWQVTRGPERSHASQGPEASGLTVEEPRVCNRTGSAVVSRLPGLRSGAQHCLLLSFHFSCSKMGGEHTTSPSKGICSSLVAVRPVWPLRGAPPASQRFFGELLSLPARSTLNRSLHFKAFEETSSNLFAWREALSSRGRLCYRLPGLLHRSALPRPPWAASTPKPVRRRPQKGRRSRSDGGLRGDGKRR